MIWSRMILKAKVLGKLALVAAAITLLKPDAALAAPPFVVSALVLYQLNSVLMVRLGNDVKPFGDYLRQIETREAALFANAGPHRARSSSSSSRADSRVPGWSWDRTSS